MAFFSLKDALSDWLRKKNFDRFLIETEVVRIVNSYLKDNKKIAPEDARAISFKNEILLIKCSHSAIASELYLIQDELKQLLKKELPEVKIKQILFHS